MIRKQPTRYVSEPLLTMLSTAEISPLAVQKAIVRQSAKGHYPVLRTGHRYLQRVRTATGLDVIGISWRYGRMLVSVEQITDGRIGWFYEESNSKDCSFRYPVNYPDAVVAAMVGRSFSAFTDDIMPLANVAIASAEKDEFCAGWLSIRLAPNWITF